MKRLPFFRRPFLARSVLEVGGGHNPFTGVTHAVDKFPSDNSQRAGNLVLARNVEFREGDLESIPFTVTAQFDFLYASHVFEHVINPDKAVDEINRVARRGYLETPSPLREQISCPYPFDEQNDFHTLFCWADSAQANTFYVVRKSASRLGEFCDCESGRLAKNLFQLRKEKGQDIEPLLPQNSKTTRIYFRTPLRLILFTDFVVACLAGHCAYATVSVVRRWSSFPFFLISNRFSQLRLMILPTGKAALTELPRP